MLLHVLSPGMQDHRKADLTAEILASELLQQLCGDFDEEIEKQFLIERNQRIENMINGEDNVIIMDGQKPFLLGFQPLRFLKRPAQWTVTILAGFEMKLPLFAYVANLQHPAHRRCAAIDNRAHGFRLLIRKPMRLFIFSDVFAENVSHIVFHP